MRRNAGEPSTRPDKSHIVDGLNHLAVPIDSIHLNPANTRRHLPEGINLLEASLARYGQRKPIVVQRQGMVCRAGNGCLMAARNLGWDQIAAVVIDEPSVDATAYEIMDNRSAEVGSLWDDEALARELLALQEDDFNLDLTGFSDTDLDSLLAELAPDLSPDLSPEEDEIPDPPEEPIVRRGDLWILGEHRVLCGDSTCAEDVARVMGDERSMLMNTDPPYGVAYANDERPNPGVAKPRVAKPRVANDSLSDERLQKFLEACFGAATSYALEKNAAWYMWHAHLTQGYFAAAAAAAGEVILHRQIIWVKPVLLLGRGQYHWKHEPCFMGWVRGHRPPDYGEGQGERTQTTVWEIGSITHAERRELNHSTPKPVGLFTIPLVKHTKPGEICYEPFAGSGPQVIAAEQLKRRCYGLEIEPRYVQVIIERWQNLTGGNATLDGSGQTFNAMRENGRPD